MLFGFLNWKKTLNQSMSNGHCLSDEERERLQNCVLDIYMDVFSACEKHGVDLFLTGGAAIGALRHQGFIPWDDDIDCGIRRKDYARFIQVLREELGDQYVVNAPNVSKSAAHRFTKILLPGTKYRELGIKPNNESQMIGIDVFIIENVPNNKLLRTAKGFICNMLEFISGQVSLVENRWEETDRVFGGALSKTYKIKLVIGRLFSFRKASKWFETLDRVAQHGNDKSRYCSIVTGRKHYFGETAPREVYFPAGYATFCGKRVKVFHDEDAYLKLMYGDYMRVPPEEERERHFLSEIDFGEYGRRQSQ